MTMHTEEIKNLEPWTGFIKEVNSDPRFANPTIATPEAYERKIDQAADDPEKLVLGILEDGVQQGLFVFSVLKDERYMEMLAGLSRSGEAYEAMAEYLQESFPGFEADFVFNPANDLLTDLLKRKGADLDPEQQFMKLTGNPPAVDTEGIELLSDPWKEQYFALHNKDMYWTGERIAEEPDFYRVFIAVEDQRVVGYIDVSWPKCPNYVCDVLVAEESRGRGWGRKLLAKAIEMNGSGGMELDVYTDNVTAIRLYESMGFTKTEGRNTVSAFWNIPEA
ncbi:MAG: GNAT family N-acetyltransferase [Clostridia bacterium]|nr:GNAT family N-acetyltransferase [Clostridia bacterium]